ncbi:unnamed protein product [Blepharisma stoltei]|uniref:Uncharacterized protein n=1 Tax=Blepharisma stoltei TaxID=1481888 RepID=A0AAU9K3X9_9CILI|nr:unnamed protein product [Blepharisma stoltei]
MIKKSFKYVAIIREMVDHDNLEESSAIIVTAIALLIASIVVFYQIHIFRVNLKYKQAQIRCIAIFMSPVVIGWASWACFFSGEEIRFIQVLIQLVKGAALFLFMQYVETLLGWTDSDGVNSFSSDILEKVLMNQHQAKCCFGCIKPYPLATQNQVKKYMRKMKIGVFQFIAVMIVTALIAIIIIGSNYDDYIEGDVYDTSSWLWMSLCRSISSMFALIYLFNFAFFVEKVPEMRDFKIKLKFFIVKLTLIITEFQPLIVGLFARLNLIASTGKYSVSEITDYTNAMLMCSEMIVVSFLQLLVYPLTDYDGLPSHKRAWKSNSIHNGDIEV